MIHIGYKEWDGTPAEANPKQEEALRILLQKDTEVLAVVGGTRGGKTSFAIFGALSLAMKTPGLTALLGHATYKYLWSSLIEELRHQVPSSRKSNNEYFYYDEETGEEYLMMVHNGTEKSLTVMIPGYIHPRRGYTIKFFYHPLDPSKKLAEKFAQSGITLNIAILDQFELLDYASWMAVFTRVSHEPRKIILTMNPPDLRFGKPWYWDFLVDEEKRKLHPGWERRKLIVMNQEDNFHISADYGRGLRDNLSESDSSRMLDGKISSAQGLVYPELKIHHIVKAEIKIPEGAYVIEIGDWGYVDGAVVQWYVRMPISQRWRLWDYIHGQEEPSEVFGTRVLQKRVELLKAGREENEKPVKFGVSYWGRDIFSKDHSGKMIAQQFMSIPAVEGQRLIPVKISNAGYNTKTGIVHSQIQCAKNMLLSDVIEFSEICADFFEQHGQYYFKEDSEEPNEYRVKTGVDRRILHHFEHMVCFRQFAWIANPMSTYNTSISSEQEHRIPDHEFQSTPKTMANPLDRLRKKMNRVTDRSYI